MKFDFPGVALELDRDALIVRSARPLHCLSSAIIGSGITDVRTILNRHVDKGYAHRDPVDDLGAFARGRGIDGALIGLMTAVWLKEACAVTLCEGDLTVVAVVTAGVRNATAAGISLPYTLLPGTINVILLADACLTSAAMVNAVITITEAKAALFGERQVRIIEGHRATGTSTDAVAIACTGAVSQCPTPGR